MAVKVRLDEVLTSELLAANKDHIRDFLEQEGIGANADLGATEVSERQVKELLAELAHDLDS